MAVGLQLFPRFLGTPPRHASRAVWGAGGITLALVARLAGQPLDPGIARSVLLGIAAVGLPVGAIVAGSAFHGLARRRPSSATGAEAWRRFAAVGGVALGCALALSVWAGVDLVLGQLVVSRGLDEALIHLELAGFATCLVFGVSSRVFGRFLLLNTRPVFECRIPLLALAWGGGLLLVTLGWLLESTWASWVRWAGALVELSVDLLLIGALVRVVAEVTGGYGPLTGPLVAVGGALGVAGFAVFAFGLGLSLRRLPGLRA